MAGIWRTVRAFISSTFRDMHAERDHLVKISDSAREVVKASDPSHRSRHALQL